MGVMVDSKYKRTLGNSNAGSKYWEFKNWEYFVVFE